MKLKIHLLIVVIFCGIHSERSFPAERSEVLFDNANKKYRAVLQNQQTSIEKRLHLIKEFEYIQKNYPQHSRAPFSLFRIGHLYRQLFHVTNNPIYLNRSLQTFRHLIKTYPNTTLVDDSQFLIGKIFEEDKKELTLALLEYNKVLQYREDQEKLALQKIKQLRVKQIPAPRLIHIDSNTSQFNQQNLGGISIDSSRSFPKAQILSLRYWATANWVKIVINTSRPIPYLYGTLPQAITKTSQTIQKFHIDLLDSQPATDVIANLKEKHQFIHNIALKQLNPRISRLTFDFNRSVSWTVFDYETSNQNTITFEFLPKKTKSPTNSLTHDTAPQQTDVYSLTKRSIENIIIDPGHGGFDPGAVGFGIYEKDIVLAIGKELKKIIEAQTSLKAFLTRETDQFVSIEERAALAHQFNGDLFISLHVNAHPVQQAHGIESYYLNVTDKPASQQLAIRENQMSKQGFQNFVIILRDLLDVSDSSQSESLTKSIHNHLLKHVNTHFANAARNLGTKEAPFLILLRAGMPATLLELAFISNPEENRRLQDRRYHKTVAEGIFQGIQNYVLQQKRG